MIIVIRRRESVVFLTPLDNGGAKKKPGAGTALHLFFLTALFFLGSNFVILDTFFARTCSEYSFLYSSMHAVFLALFTLEASLRIE